MPAVLAPIAISMGYGQSFVAAVLSAVGRRRHIWKVLLFAETALYLSHFACPKRDKPRKRRQELGFWSPKIAGLGEVVPIPL